MRLSSARKTVMRGPGSDIDRLRLGFGFDLDRDGAAHDGALTGLRRDRYRSVERLDAIGDVLRAGAARRRGGIEAAAIVLDAEGQVTLVAPKGDGDRLGVGVLA